MIESGDGATLKCVLPCRGSSKCDCLSGWEVTQTNHLAEVSIIIVSRLKCKRIYCLNCITGNFGKEYSQA